MKSMKFYFLFLFSLIFSISNAQFLRFKKVKSIEFELKSDGINSGAKLIYIVYANTVKGKRVDVTSSRYLDIWGEGFKVVNKGLLLIDKDTTCNNNHLVVNCRLRKNDCNYSA